MAFSPYFFFIDSLPQVYMAENLNHWNQKNCHMTFCRRQSGDNMIDAQDDILSPFNWIWNGIELQLLPAGHTRHVIYCR